MINSRRFTFGISVVIGRRFQSMWYGLDIFIFTLAYQGYNALWRIMSQPIYQMGCAVYIQMKLGVGDWEVQHIESPSYQGGLYATGPQPEGAKQKGVCQSHVLGHSSLYTPSLCLLHSHRLLSPVQPHPWELALLYTVMHYTLSQCRCTTYALQCTGTAQRHSTRVLHIMPSQCICITHPYNALHWCGIRDTVLNYYAFHYPSAPALHTYIMQCPGIVLQTQYQSIGLIQARRPVALLLPT